MTTWWKRLGRAAEATIEYHGAGRFEIRSEVVACPICQGDEFVRVPESREVGRPLFARVNVPWLKLDRRSTGLICTHCTHILSFGLSPNRVEGDG